MIAFLKQRRNAWVVAAILFGLGLWASAAILLSVLQEIAGLDKGFIRMLAPGEETLALPQAGPYTVYFEHKSEMDGKMYFAPSDAIAGLALTIHDAENGEAIPVRIAASKSTYSLGSREGTSLMSFVVPKPGLYRFVATVPPRDGEGPFVLAIGPGIMKDVFSLIAKIFGMVFVLIATIAIPTVLIVTSSASKLSAGKPQQR